jgi:hypothetical protein
MESRYQVMAFPGEISGLLRDLFLANAGPAIAGHSGTVELDFRVSEDGSLSINRLLSTNADLYAYFRKKVNTVRVEDHILQVGGLYSFRVVVGKS